MWDDGSVSLGAVVLRLWTARAPHADASTQPLLEVIVVNRERIRRLYLALERLAPARSRHEVSISSREAEVRHDD
eukprot:89765-Prymnesium_polylepis.3